MSGLESIDSGEPEQQPQASTEDEPLSTPDLQSRFTNPTVVPGLEADARELPGSATSSNEHGQPLVTLAGDMRFIGVTADELAEANSAIRHAPALDKLEFNMSTVQGKAEDPDFIVKASHANVSGMGFNAKSDLVAGYIWGPPLRCVDACLLPTGDPQIKGQLVPFMEDGIFIDGQNLDPEQLAKLGISFAKDENGAHLKYPVLLDGPLTMLLPGSFRIPVAETEQGGYQILRDDDNEHSLAFRAVALKFRGNGAFRYIYHVAEKHPSGKVHLEEGEVILEGGDTEKIEDAAVVQRSAYAGKSGVFLDVYASPSALTPLGGYPEGIALMERDAKLLGAGARMGCITLAVAPLISNQELRNEFESDTKIRCEKLSLVLQACLRDTHTLASFNGAPLPQDGVSPALENLIVRDFGSYTDEHRDKYLDLLNHNLGHNINICLNLGLTIPGDVQARRHLNVFGEIQDSSPMLPMRNRYQGYPMIDRWLTSAVNVAKLGGINPKEYYASRAFESFVEAMFPGEDTTALLKSLRAVIRPMKPFHASTTVAREWIKRSMTKEGVTISSNALLKTLRKNEHLADRFLEDTGFRFDKTDIKRLVRGEISKIKVAKALPMNPVVSLERGRFIELVRDAYIGLVLRCQVQGSDGSIPNLGVISVLPEAKISAGKGANHIDNRRSRPRPRQKPRRKRR